MKRLIVLTMIALSMCCVAFGQKTKTASANDKMIVNDYFMQIPEQYIKADSRKRAGWVDTDNKVDGYLAFTIPFAELDVEGGEDANAFGSLQLFKKDKGGVIVGLAINMCVDKVCEGQLLFLDYNGGKWDNITDEVGVSTDNDEIVNLLNNSPATDNTYAEDDEIPLATGFYGPDKLVKFVAECKVSFDGGVVVKQYKWNGERFTAYEDPEGFI